MAASLTSGLSSAHAWFSRRSTPLDRAVDREQQRRQGRENHENNDAAARF
jgi:hypothetical protein